jgi:hypothetical protein
MRKSWADSKVAPYLPKVTAIFDLVLNGLIGIYLFFTANQSFTNENAYRT